MEAWSKGQGCWSTNTLNREFKVPRYAPENPLPTQHPRKDLGGRQEGVQRRYGEDIVLPTTSPSAVRSLEPVSSTAPVGRTNGRG